MDLITLAEACKLLEISRPTLNSYRRKYRLRETEYGGKIRLSKTEIIQKIILPVRPSEADQTLSMRSYSSVEELQPLPGVYDLRKLKGIDAYGVMALLCSIKTYLKDNESNQAHLLLDGSPLCSYLESIGFFSEVLRGNAGRVFYNEDIKKWTQTRSAVILPLHLIGYRGAEKKILDELYDPLLKQGFTESYCGHIGWIIGELCDNAHTHSEGPCYLVIEALPVTSTATRFLTIAVGDTGIGIPTSLRKNAKYSELPDEILLPMAFQSEVSRMEVEPKRGKGLNDVMAISKGNSSWLRAESCELGMSFDFRDGQDKIQFTPPIVKTPGTRFCLVLIDGTFEEVPRAKINEIMQGFIEKL